MAQKDKSMKFVKKTKIKIDAEAALPWSIKSADTLEGNPLINEIYVNKQGLSDKIKQDVLRERIKEKIQYIKRQWKDLETNEEKFKELFNHMNNFIESNLRKKKFSQHRFAKHQESFNKSSNDVKILLKKRQAITDFINRMDKKIEEMDIYEAFLDKVIEETRMYKNIPAILLRYHNVVEANDKAHRKFLEIAEELNESHIVVKTFICNKEDMIEKLSHDCLRLVEKYTNVKQKSMFFGYEVHKISEKTNELYAELPSVRSCIDHLSDFIVNRSHCSIDKSNIRVKSYQLEVIKHYIRTLQTILPKPFHDV